MKSRRGSMAKVLDLFSGIGGFSLGLERAGMETVAFCEIEPFCQKVLARHWPDVPIYSDIRTLTRQRLIDDGILADTSSARSSGSGSDKNDAEEGTERRDNESRSRRHDRGFTGTSEDGANGKAGNTTQTIDLICGGYPCQPFSHAGKRGGEKDDRHLWPEMYRIIKDIRPRWVVAENVAGHITMGLDAVLSDLEAANYTWWTFVIPACAVDAKHRRDRVWIIAQDDSNSHITGSHRKTINQHGEGKPANGKEREPGQVCEVLAGRENAAKRDAENVADTKRQRQQGQRQPFNASHSKANEEGKTDQSVNVSEPQVGSVECGLGGMVDGIPRWLDEPNFPRVITGQPDRTSRLRALGNSVVPQVVEVIGRAIMETVND